MGGTTADTITENGSLFNSKEFSSFVLQWAFVHMTFSPLYTKLNGFIEHDILNLKTFLNKVKVACLPLPRVLLHI